MQLKHLSVVEKLSLIAFTSFSFAQTVIHDFQNIVLNLYCHSLRQMPQK